MFVTVIQKSKETKEKKDRVTSYHASSGSVTVDGINASSPYSSSVAPNYIQIHIVHLVTTALLSYMCIIEL